MEGVGKVSLGPQLQLIVLVGVPFSTLQLKLTSRFHVGRSIVYELLDLLGHNLGTVPR